MSKSRFAFSYCLIVFVLPTLAAASAAASTIYSFGVAITIGEAIGGEKVVNFGFPSLSDTGTLAFCADLKNGQLNDSGVVIYSGGAKTFIAKQGAQARVRPDQKVVLFYDWEKPSQRLHGTTAVLRNLVRIAEQAKAA